MQEITWGDAPDVESVINGNSVAIFAACENEFPGAWRANCFAHLTRANFPKHKNACVQEWTQTRLQGTWYPLEALT